MRSKSTMAVLIAVLILIIFVTTVQAAVTNVTTKTTTNVPRLNVTSNVTTITSQTTQASGTSSVQGTSNVQGTSGSGSMTAQWFATNTGKIRHYDLYVTDGYINKDDGTFIDATSIAGWGTDAGGSSLGDSPYAAPVYIWGYTDIDPEVLNSSNSLPTVPAKALAVQYGPLIAGTKVGNAKFPAPFLEAIAGEDVYVTVHNRGFYQELQTVQDDHNIHWHGIHAQTQYDGFPESAGGYTEKLRFFWEEPWYLSHGANTRARDAWWNGLTKAQQQTNLLANAPKVRDNKLNPSGGITALKNDAPVADGGIGGLSPADAENATQFTFYFKAEFPGTYMYHCHVAASEHVQMGLYGALVIRPTTSMYTSIYGTGTGSDFSAGQDYTFILSDFDPKWHADIEGADVVAIDNSMNPGTGTLFQVASWKPQLWFINGRTFPTTLRLFAWDNGDTEPRYNTAIKMAANQKFAIRYINMGYASYPIHQHGWHFRIVGTDATPLTLVNQYSKYTLNIGSGETYDTITVANPVYGVTSPAGSPLARLYSGAQNLKWRQVYPLHIHDDYKATTNGFYPGGMTTLMEVTVPGAGSGTWFNPYADQIQNLPPIPAPAGAIDVTEVESNIAHRDPGNGS